MSPIAIVIVGYNRLNSLQRVISSLEKAVFKEKVDLIFDLDKADSSEVEDYANRYIWNYGKKHVRTYQLRQGLRAHMVALSYWFAQYDALIVLEDDIYVSPCFYQYCKGSILEYQNEPDIIGIGMYNFNYPGSCHNPIQMKNDNYFIQAPTSWGQVWLKKQWLQFEQWYEKNKDRDIVENYIPQDIRNYPKTSYLKYLNTYMIEEKKYFAFPYQGFSTCFSDAGQHAVVSGCQFQTPMRMEWSNFDYAKFNSDAIIYDCFFELSNLKKYLPLNNEDCLIDLKGGKEYMGDEKFILTSKMLNNRIIKAYGRKMRPLEMNIICNVEGTDIFLYDMSVSEHNSYKNSSYDEVRYRYGDEVSSVKMIIVILKGKIKTILEKVKNVYK